MKILKVVKIAVFLVMGFPGLALAYEGTLGTAVTATDRWYFQCLNPNNKYIHFGVVRFSGTPCVKAKFDNTGTIRTACTTGYSNFPWSNNIATGPGAKFFTITKTATGPVTYSVRAHCVDKNGVENAADQTWVQTYVQNQ